MAVVVRTPAAIEESRFGPDNIVLKILPHHILINSIPVEGLQPAFSMLNAHWMVQKAQKQWPEFTGPKVAGINTRSVHTYVMPAEPPRDHRNYREGYSSELGVETDGSQYFTVRNKDGGEIIHRGRLVGQKFKDNPIGLPLVILQVGTGLKQGHEILDPLNLEEGTALSILVGGFNEGGMSRGWPTDWFRERDLQILM